MPDGPLTTPERVQAVISVEDATLRNLLITESYHELLVALDRYLGADLNWCAFATWASKQAGVFIRLDQVPPPLRDFLGLDGGRRRGWTPTGFLKSSRFLRYARMTAGDVSGHVAAGNRLVYAHLAPLFAGFLDLLRGHQRDDPAALEAFVAGIGRSGSDREGGGRDELRRAFGHLWAARWETDPARRAERILLGNLLVGWHEQRRLQEAIDGALSAPIRRALDDPGCVWFRTVIPLPLRMAGAKVFAVLMAPWIRRVEAEWKAAATRCLMTLALPTGELALGADVPPLADGSTFPEALRAPALEETLALLAALDRTPDSLAGSAARDWARLEDRMNYVADFFRSRQQERSLLDTAPFTAEQVAMIHLGRRPPGVL